uniref:Uncharacterized protein n=2 Tax=Triticum urartu TaxID=4572 RepID=A0A8R7UQB3_TRIUA
MIVVYGGGYSLAATFFLGDLAEVFFLGDLASFSAAAGDFLGSSTELMLGITPPWAMVTPASSLPSSWSLRTASSRWRGMMRVFLLSLAATGKICAYLCGEVLEDGGEVDGGAGADALGVAALLEVAPDAADGELEPGLHGPGHGLLPVASLPSGHLACYFSGDE